RQGVGEPSVYHAVVVIFLEFFAWGLLTTPMLTVLHQTFPQHTFLMNGLIHGVKVSATFAASLVTSPAIGAYLARAYSDTLVVVLASGVALLDIGFILIAVPESLPEEMRPVSWGAPISWEQADPFAVIGFSSETVATFIGVVGILSILAQTVVLGVLMRSIGNKNTILLGLGFQILQLAWYGFGSQQW
ncbi:hypothetical protein AB205_0102170, partial [Aquarana catesbeiana]